MLHGTTEDYTFCENRLAGPETPQHIRRLAPGEERSGGGYQGKPSLCGDEVHWDVDFVTRPIVEASAKIRAAGKYMPGMICLKCSNAWEELGVG